MFLGDLLHYINKGGEPRIVLTSDDGAFEIEIDTGDNPLLKAYIGWVVVDIKVCDGFISIAIDRAISNSRPWRNR